MSVGAVSGSDTTASVLAQYLAQLATTKKTADQMQTAKATQAADASASKGNDVGGSLDLKA